jgi:hypothetical protein
MLLKLYKDGNIFNVVPLWVVSQQPPQPLPFDGEFRYMGPVTVVGSVHDVSPYESLTEVPTSSCEYMKLVGDSESPTEVYGSSTSAGSDPTDLDLLAKRLPDFVEEKVGRKTIGGQKRRRLK